MSIELLWIIPVVAAALLILMILLTIQQSKGNELDGSNTYDLKREVDEYNSGVKERNEVIPHSSESRLSEIEKTIQLVSTALSSQQQTIENFQGKDSKFVDELNELKQKLQELQNEYDTIISENYTLRARLNKIEDRKIADDIPQLSTKDDPSQDKTDYLKRDKLLNLKIYEKKSSKNSTKLTDLDDTSEINISEIS
jgi:regulator of replication initiation timing